MWAGVIEVGAKNGIETAAGMKGKGSAWLARALPSSSRQGIARGGIWFSPLSYAPLP